MIGRINGYGTQRLFHRDTLIGKEHVATVIHDTCDSILDIAQRFNRRHIPVRVK
ncbi:hypothetical protein D3C72_2525660 [compost metagenome]